MAIYSLDISSVANHHADIIAKLTAVGVYGVTKFSDATRLYFSITRNSKIICLTNGGITTVIATSNSGATLFNQSTIMSLSGTILEAELIITVNVLVYIYRLSSGVFSMVIGLTDKGYPIIFGVFSGGGASGYFMTSMIPALATDPSPQFGQSVALNSAGTNYLQSPIHLSDNYSGDYYGTLVGAKFISRVPLVTPMHYVIGNDVLLQGSSNNGGDILITNGAI